MKSLIKKENKEKKQDKQNKGKQQAQCCAKTSVAIAGCHD